MKENVSIVRDVELRACPFCGGEPYAVAIFQRNTPHKSTPWVASIHCSGKCLATMGMPGPPKSTKEQAVRETAELWNRRIADDYKTYCPPIVSWEEEYRERDSA